MLAIDAYCRIPFKDSNKKHPLVIWYAKLLGRTPSAVNLKIGNLGRLDPKLKAQGITGLVHGARLEETIWQEFKSDPEAFAVKCTKLKNLYAQKENRIDNYVPQGEEYTSSTTKRIGQEFFRAMVLSSYSNHCCITGIGNEELLEACHIVSWKDDPTNRINPQNGICLCPLFHKAYDQMLLGITPDFQLIIADKMFDCMIGKDFRQYLMSINNKKLTQPDKFHPDQELLDIHFQQFIHAN